MGLGVWGFFRILSSVSGLLALGLGCASMSRNHTMDNVRFGMTRPEVRTAIGAPDREDKISEKDETWVYAVDGDVCNLEFVSGMLIRPPRCTSESQRAWIRELAEVRDDANKLERAQAEEQHAQSLLVAQREAERLKRIGKLPPPPPPVVEPPKHASREPQVECYLLFTKSACNVDYSPKH